MMFDEFTIKTHIATIQDWPRPGFTYRDLSPLLRNNKAMRMVFDTLIQRYIELDFTHIGALDARGFLIGGNLAYALNKPLILFRKAGKLPSPTDSVHYQSPYNSGDLEIQKESFTTGDKVLLVDDLIATGNTLFAATELIKMQGGMVAEIATVIDLIGQGGSEKLTAAGFPFYTLCIFDH